jgi:hypothetical protein
MDKVRLRHGNALLVFRSQFQAIEEDVEVAALQARDKLVPLILDHAGLDPELGRQGLSHFVLEPDQLLRPLRVRIDVRRPTLGIRAPEQHAPLTDFLQAVCRQRTRTPAGNQENLEECAKRQE